MRTSAGVSILDETGEPWVTAPTLHVVGGLANRLRAVLSHRALHGGKLSVVWQPDEYVSHARFLDVFGPLEGVEFVNGPWDLEDYAPAKGAPEGWERAYSELRPVADVQKKIDAIRDFFRGGYLACHARKTDHIPNRGGQVENDETFWSWASRWPRLDLYLATDNGETQRRFLACGRAVRIGCQLGGKELQDIVDHRRNGTLADAVVDLYTCAGATHFLGSRGSSFSDAIVTLRSLRNE